MSKHTDKRTTETHLTGLSQADSIRVLHVDDEPGFVDLAARRLEQADDRFHIETAPTADEGLDRLTADFDCIVSDYDMPAMDGIEFLETVRDSYPDLPFILFTGKGSEEVASDAFTSGATDYLQKQSGEQYELLANRISNAVAQYRAKRAERHLAELAESTDRILYIFNRDWSELLFINSAYEEIWGRSVDDLRADPTDFLNGIHPDFHDLVQENMAKMSAGESITIEYRVNADEDFGRWVRVRGEPILDETGTTVRVAGFATDITAEKHRQQALEHQQSVLTSVVETVPHGLLVVDENREFFTYNQQFVDMWDIPDDVVATGDDEQALEAVLDQLARPDEFLERVEYFYDNPHEESRDRIHLADGRTFERYTGPVIGERDAVLGRVWIFQDITESRDRERELERQNDLFAQAQELAAIGAWEADLRSDEGWWTDQVCRIFGLPIEYEPGPGEGLEYVQPEDRPTVEAAFDRAVEAGEPFDLEYRIVREDGATRWVRSQAEPQRTEGRIVSVRGTIQDITARKERERELERQNERLDEFASVVSHDLRNPLNVARGRLEMVREEFDSEDLAAVARAHDRMEDLIDDLLTLARSGERVAESEPVELAAITHRSWRNVETNEATLITEADLTFLADAGPLQQLLENLIQNAVEHGGDGVTVRVGAIDGADGFYAADDGPGIPEDQLTKVFDTGFSTSESGTGFGLSIAEGIAEAHDWAIRATKGRHGGARFEIIGVDVVPS